MAAKKKATTAKTGKPVMVKVAESIGYVAGTIAGKKDQLVRKAGEAIDVVKTKLHLKDAKKVKATVKKAAKKAKASTKKVVKKVARKAASKVATAKKKVSAARKSVRKVTRKAARG